MVGHALLEGKRRGVKYVVSPCVLAVVWAQLDCSRSTKMVKAPFVANTDYPTSSIWSMTGRTLSWVLMTSELRLRLLVSTSQTF